MRSAIIRILAGVLLVFGGALRAQGPEIRRDNEPFLAEPGGVRLARVSRGVMLRPGMVRSGHTQVTLEGWIFRSSVEPASRDGHNLRVLQPENLRAEPNGRVLARLVTGCLLDEVQRAGNWVRVRRTGWVASSGLAVPATAAARAPQASPDQRAQARPEARQAPAQIRLPRDTTRTAAPVEVDPRRAVVRRRMQLYRAPDSSAIGYLEAGLPVRITARAGGWVRVEAQGWVRESEIRLSDAAILSGITAAELRAAPEEFRGRLLRWTIQFISLQTADDLRPDLSPGQRYILARGPAPEYAFVYIVVPPDKLAEIQRLEPLARVAVVARVISGRSTYLGNPILQLVELQ